MVFYIQGIGEGEFDEILCTYQCQAPGGGGHMRGIRSPFMSPPPGILLKVLDPGRGHLKNGAEDLC